MNSTVNDSGSGKCYEPEELVSELTLSMVDGVGAMLTQRLLDHFGNAESVLNAAPTLLQEVEGIGSKIAKNISQAHSVYHSQTLTLIAQCRQHGISLISKRDVRYPDSLRNIADPPLFLYLRGTIRESDHFAVAVVGTRHATQYGQQQAERLASELSQCGFTIVSGLALGIDGAAHRGALAANGRTIAVLGGGLLHIFPQEHRNFANDVIANGAIISEYFPDQIPQKGMFPQRNRIISGLSLGVLIIEAHRQSGALITATLAVKQNRKIFALPGPVNRDSSRGCHQLIREGAVLVETADDLLKHLKSPLQQIPHFSPITPPISHQPLQLPTEQHPAKKTAAKDSVSSSAPLPLNEMEMKVLPLIAVDPTPIDLVISGSGLPVHQVLATLSILEMRRLVRRCEANTVIRVNC
jgi:DNA processing protein